jgi:hypothetical protein
MESKESKPGLIHLKIIEVMKQFPGGVSGGQIRQELEKQGLQPEDQTHLDRRKRDLKKWFNIRKIPSGVVVNGKERKVVLYQYLGEKQRVSDEGQINLKLRAEVIHGAHGRFRLPSGWEAANSDRTCPSHPARRSTLAAPRPSASFGPFQTA